MKIRNKILIQLWALRLTLYGIFLGVNLAYAFLIGKPLELFVVLAAYTTLRWCFPTTWHHHKTLNCICYSTVGFCIFNTLTIPMSISLFGGVLTGYLISLGLYILQDRIDSKILLKEFQNKTIWNMNETELREYCRIKGIKRDRIDFVVYVLIHHWRFADIAIKLGYSLETIKDWSEICKRKLNIKSWEVDKQ